ncbi:anti-sigma factor family protein [Dictyobacter aurantiacus]|uniref:Zinc-finger domain-containing protein n=1 Tax=Dictyobacter aurantiacus TaxID=1936993 RepID=A0A401ZHQ8_9CHLR|nr:zf-HC2 domain-containing protein [Dictyobacter aurantiacus]GCE06376.1 hypothetical protein KDAU_37050 [Dictyobacter aurantiacus]
MNCRQARAMLAIYREQKQDPTETAELEDHLAHCAECKDAYAQYQLVGERIRSMPAIEPDPDAHQKLMQALAAEHVRFLQRTPAASTPTPVFLAPYLKDLAKQPAHADSLAAFSTATTGPLPVLQVTRPRRSRSTQHIAIIGLAASFLVVVMLGGLVSLLLLANQGQPGVIQPNNNQASITHPEPAQADTNTVSTQTNYPHIASSVVSANTIYYSAYNEDGSSWMLEKFDTTGDANATHQSSPLLATPATRPLLILGSSDNWLLWLQMEAPKQPAGKQSHTATAQSDNQPGKLTGAWSLKALYIGQDASTQNQQNPQDGTADFAKPLTLRTDTFNSSTVADWVNTPIQGVSFYTDHALVALIDSKGISHLLNYQFSQNALDKSTELARAQDQHVLTSPTASSDGHSIYWSDEWQTPENKLNSNIWTQQTVQAAPSKTGRWIDHPETQTYLYRDDGTSFRPQIVTGTLFFLTTNGSATANATVAATETPTAGVTPTATSTAAPTASATAQATATPTRQDLSNLLANPTEIDPTVITPQIDMETPGKLLAFTTDGVTPVTTNISDSEVLTGLQSGGSFLIWQNSSTRGFKMYDTRARVMVNGIDSIDRTSTALVSVNGTTVIWTKYVAPDPNNSDPTAQSNITFTTLKWPK